MLNLKYSMKHDGLYAGELYIANFRISPVSKVRKVDLDGHIIDIQYQLQAIFPDNSKGKIISVKDYKKINYSSIWEQCIDATLSAKQKKMLLEDLQINLQDIEWTETTVLTTNGLVHENPCVFVYDKNHIIHDDRTTSYESVGDMPVFNIKEADKESIINYINQLLGFYPEVTDVLLMVHLLAQLKPLLNSMGETVDCMASLIGKSRSLKTTYADILTVNSPEQMLKFTIDNAKKAKDVSHKYNGHCICVDDYHRVNQKYLKDKQNDMLDFLARNTNNPNNAFVVITGEYIDGIVSLQDRLIQINVRKCKGDFNKEQLALLNNLQKNKYILHYFYYDFSKKVYSDISSTKKIIEENIHELYTNRTGYRIDRNAGLLKIAAKVFKNLYSDYLSCDMYGNIENSINNIVKSQAIHMNRIEELEYNQDWALIIYNAINKRCVPEQIEYSVIKQMFTDNKDILYVTPLALETGLEKYLECSINIEQAVKYLYKKQLLYTDNSTALTIKRDGTRYYAIKINALQYYYKNHGDVAV